MRSNNTWLRCKTIDLNRNSTCWNIKQNGNKETKCEYEEQKKEPTKNKTKHSTQTMQIQYIQRIQMHDCEIYKCYITRIQRMSSCIE